MLNLILAAVFSAGLFILFKINPFEPLGRIDYRKILNLKPKKKKVTAGEFVRTLEGKKRDNLISRSFRESKNSFALIGQESRYKRTLILSAVCGGGGFLVSLMLFGNFLLSIVFTVGFALIPQWAASFAVYRYTMRVNAALETSLSLITSAYMRHNDIVKAIKENSNHASQPVKGVLEKFVNTVTYFNPDIETAVLQMENDLDNTVFRQWCDTLILCQSDHTLKAGLMPIVSKITTLKKLQQENETQMTEPIRNIIIMICFPVLFIVFVAFGMPEWYGYIAYTLPGHISLMLTAVVAFAGVNKAIKLSQPVDFKL
jgi:Flp pilus assembly protein TadB